MAKPSKLFPLLFCFLFIFCSLVRADLPQQKDFDFLKNYNDASMVESGLELFESAAGLSLSTLVNFGIWFSVCATPEIVSQLASRFRMDIYEESRLSIRKTKFCLQLASVITTAEVALAGHISPWSLEQTWWQTLRFAGAGMAVYADYAKSGRKWAMPVVTLIYLVAEASARTLSSTVSTLMLRKTDSTNIKPVLYDYRQYTWLSIVSGLMVGGVIYEALIKTGQEPAKAALAFAISASAAGAMSAIASISMLNLDGESIDEATTGVAAGARGRAGITVGITAGTAARVAVAAGAVTGVGALFGAAAAAIAGGGGGAIAGAGAADAAGAAVAAGAGMVAGATVGTLLPLASLKIAPNNPAIKASVALVPALSFALFNSLSNYAVYGNPIENSLSETARTQWRKFYAPLDYLATLFN